LGRFLAQAVAARIDLPAFDNSAVDGYAVHEDDLKGGPSIVKFIVRAGECSHDAVSPGECARIFTGAPIPPGTAAVVMQEDVELDPVRLPPAERGAHIRRQAEEIRVGDELAIAGQRLSPALIAALASAGVEEVSVRPTPRIGLLVTGDELVSPGTPLRPGQIYESNSLGIAAAVLTATSAEPTILRAKDDPDEIRAALRQLLSENDIVLTSGGISVGDYDLIRPALESLGVKEVFWRVAMKPAKPTYFGVHDRGVVFGLPGNPVSAQVAFRLFVAPYLTAAQGGPFELNQQASRTTLAITKAAGREEFVPGVRDEGGVRPILGRASHKPTCLADADMLIRVPSEVTELPVRSEVMVIPL